MGNQYKKYKLTDAFEIERQKRNANINTQSAVTAPARQDASKVVESWGDSKNMSSEAVDNYTKKVQALYDSEAQRRAASDAEFQRSLRYLPQQFKAAGLYGSGQSESMLTNMNVAQANAQNEITADTNKDLRTLQDDYADDVEAEKLEKNTEVDELANYFSASDWTNRTTTDLNNFIEYFKDAGYSDEVINKAINQVVALNPDVGRQIEALRTTANNEVTGGYAMTTDELNKATMLANADVKINGNLNLIRHGRDFTVTYNGKEYKMEGRAPADADTQNILDSIAKQGGITPKAGTLLAYNGELYVYSGQVDKGWRTVKNEGFEWYDILAPFMPFTRMGAKSKGAAKLKREIN